MKFYNKKFKTSMFLLIILFPLLLLPNMGICFIQNSEGSERGINLSASNYTLGYSQGDTFIFKIIVYDAARLSALGISLGSGAKLGAMRCYEIVSIDIVTDDWTITYKPWNWADDINAFHSPSPYQQESIEVYNNTADFGTNNKYIHPDIMSIVGKPVLTYLSLIDWDGSVIVSNYIVEWNAGLYKVQYIYNQEGILNNYIVKEGLTEILQVDYTGARPPQDPTLLIIIVVILLISVSAVIVVVVIKKKKSGEPKVKPKKQKGVMTAKEIAKAEKREAARIKAQAKIAEPLTKSKGAMTAKEIEKVEKRENIRRKEQAKIARVQAIKDAEKKNVEAVRFAKENLKKAKAQFKQKGLDYADKINIETDVMRAKKALALAVKESQERMGQAKKAGKISAVGLSKELKKARTKETTDIKKIDKELKGKLKRSAKSDKRMKALIEQENVVKVTITSKCPECFWVLSSAATICPRCGWEKPVDDVKYKPKPEIEEKFVSDEHTLCPTCGKINPVDIKICKFCGQEMADETKKICYNCDEIIAKTLKVCIHCGADVVGTGTVKEVKEEASQPLEPEEPEGPSIQEQIDEINKQVSETHKQIDIINEDFYAKEISQEEYLEKKNQMYEKLGELQAKLTMLNQ
jgi:hypothetical protein